MGGGYWNKNDFVKYSRTRGRRVTLDGRIDISMVRDAREMYTNGYLADELDPKNVRDVYKRESRRRAGP